MIELNNEIMSQILAGFVGGILVLGYLVTSWVLDKLDRD